MNNEMNTTTSVVLFIKRFHFIFHQFLGKKMTEMKKA